MVKKAYLMQMGMGSDLHGSNDTKAAVRAVNDSIQNNNMLFLKHLNLQDWNQFLVEVVIATPNPEKVDTDAVKSALPVGRVTVTLQQGGMQVDSDDRSDPVLVAIASVTVSINE